MTSQHALSAARAYLRLVRDTLATGHATEHSYRPALKQFVETLGGSVTKALNEPSHVECGAPDYIVEQDGVPQGHIECKDVGTNLDVAANSDQLKRYRASLPNLILTDYLEFRWYTEGELRESARIGRLDGSGGITSEREGVPNRSAAHPGLFLQRRYSRPSTSPATSQNVWRLKPGSCETE